MNVLYLGRKGYPGKVNLGKTQIDEYTRNHKKTNGNYHAGKISPRVFIRFHEFEKSMKCFQVVKALKVLITLHLQIFNITFYTNFNFLFTMYFFCLVIITMSKKVYFKFHFET